MDDKSGLGDHGRDINKVNVFFLYKHLFKYMFVCHHNSKSWVISESQKTPQVLFMCSGDITNTITMLIVNRNHALLSCPAITEKIIRTEEPLDSRELLLEIEMLNVTKLLLHQCRLNK